MQFRLLGATLLVTACAQGVPQRPAEMDALLDSYFSCIQKEVALSMSARVDPYLSVDGAVAECDVHVLAIEKAHRREGFSSDVVRTSRRIVTDEGRKLGVQAAAFIARNQGSAPIGR
ncbi:hypothetical protein ACIU1J_27520 [Azospirillum doebereinerae]|uniref:hypothetical protein n=1 Tax=Azospirillum doebereinerae TaxID=92933 RepID=UPI001EE5C53D|nr:hypothetical protein [Azospirillum doebereinerae]MCG5241369.1 hypothetical protein [Azospirillum doebereinerae]